MKANGSFSSVFDQQVAVGPVPGNHAFFGRNVLRGLVEGIDDFVAAREQRWERRFRTLGPAMIACSPWFDDAALIEALGKLSAVNIMIRKPGGMATEQARRRLQKANERLGGLPIRAFPTLGAMAPSVDGRPRVIGPYDNIDEDQCLPPIRALGFRGAGNAAAPIAHAKLALLGRLWWHDEGAHGYPEDVVGFRPQRLWVSSANFTANSRRCLEFGYWTEDAALVTAAEAFLVQLLRASEPVETAADDFRPELAPIEFDDEAMVEALADSNHWSEDGLEDGP